MTELCYPMLVEMQEQDRALSRGCPSRVAIKLWGAHGKELGETGEMLEPEGCWSQELPTPPHGACSGLLAVKSLKTLFHPPMGGSSRRPLPDSCGFFGELQLHRWLFLSVCHHPCLCLELRPD